MTFCKICEHYIVLQEGKSKQKQFQVHNSYKTREQSNKPSYCFGKNEENMDLSHIHLAVEISKRKFWGSQCSPNPNDRILSPDFCPSLQSVVELEN